jgi:hypothetical protein
MGENRRDEAKSREVLAALVERVGLRGALAG